MLIHTEMSKSTTTVKKNYVRENLSHVDFKYGPVWTKICEFNMKSV